MEYVSLGIVVLSVYAAFNDRIHTNGKLLHLLWAAATFSACGVVGSPLGMIFGLLFAMASAAYFAYSEFCNLLTLEDELEE